MKPHEFQFVARQFRAGKISLNDFTERIFPASGKTDAEASEGLLDSLWQRLLDRPAESHKGDYGRVLIIAGSLGMAGAAGLSGLAALRSGAGLVTVVTDNACQGTVAAYHPSLMTGSLPLTGHLEEWNYPQLCRRLPPHDCIAIGPGIGFTPATRKLVGSVVESARVPVVVDADGLNCLAADGYDFATSRTPLVLTPHPGEMRRLMKQPSDDRERQIAYARELAAECRGVVVLKGHRTLVTDGDQTVHNLTGNPGMATAGSGDVLTGMIAALIGQRFTPWESAVLGCHWHGLAGDQAAQRKSQVSVISTDILDNLPIAILKSQNP